MRYSTTLFMTLCALMAGAAALNAARADKPAALPQTGEKAFPAQSTVAAKAAFATVAASDKGVVKALAAKALADAAKQVGKPGAFQGTVSKVYTPHGNGAVILDFAPNYREALTAAIRPDAYAKFPDLAKLEGKHVLISGKFVLFHDAPQILLTSPSQVKIIR